MVQLRIFYSLLNELRLDQGVGEVLECPVVEIVGYSLAFCLPDLLESLLGLLALADVFDYRDKVLRLPRRVAHERDGEVDPDG